MDAEEKSVKLNQRGTIMEGTLQVFEDMPNESGKSLIVLSFNEQSYFGDGEELFSALQSLRYKLEKENIQILCNGAVKNIYPSTMSMSMGAGRLAYKMTDGQHAKTSDLVDIFDCNETLEFTDVETQKEYYWRWVKSFRKR